MIDLMVNVKGLRFKSTNLIKRFPKDFPAFLCLHYFLQCSHLLFSLIKPFLCRGSQMYSLPHPLRPKFIDAIAYFTIPPYIQNDQDRTHDSSPPQTVMYTSGVPHDTNTTTQQPCPKPAEFFLSSRPISEISATADGLSLFTSLHLCSDSNHFYFIFSLIHFTDCTAVFCFLYSLSSTYWAE